MKYVFTVFILLFLFIPLTAQEYQSKSYPKEYTLRKVKPDVSVNINFKNESNPGSYFKAYDEGTYKVEITNLNEYELSDLSLLLSCTAMNDITITNTNQYIGTLSPQATRNVEFKIIAGNFVPAGSVQFDFTLKEKSTGIIKVETNMLQTSVTQTADVKLDKVEISDQNNDGFLEADEKMIVRFTLKNQGKGSAYNVKTRVSLEDGSKVISGSIREVNIGTLAQNDTQVREFVLFNPDNSANLRLTVSDNNNIVINKTVNVKEQFTNELASYIPDPGNVNPDAVAVIIGNSSYEDSDVPGVSYAVKDARMMKEYLIKTMGYSEENIIYNINAKLSDLNAIFGTKDQQGGRLSRMLIGRKGDVFIYYSGHGAPDLSSKSGYIVASDSKPDEISSTGYSLETFYNNLSKLDYRSLIVVVDACFSGFSEGGALIKDASPLVIKVDDPTLRLTNAAVFTSASGDEISSWYPEKKHSLFTYYFLKGIQDGETLFGTEELKVSDLKNYVQQQVSNQAMRMKNRKQTPQISGDENIIMVEY